MLPAIEMDPSADFARGFCAEQTIWDLGRFALTRALMPDGALPRTWRHVGRDPLDHWCLVLVRDREAGSGQHAPGRLFLRSLGRPFLGRSADEEVISLYIPRDLEGGISRRFERLPQDLGRSALLDLLADYISSLEQKLATARVEEVPAIVQATEAMISTCLVPSRDDLADAGEVLSLSLMERAKRTIRQELLSRDLTPDFLARSLGISRSGLYRLFEPYGGVRHVIQRERLHAAHAALCAAGPTGPILAIAERSGFIDASSFSRAFRREFGYSPTEVRVAAAIGAGIAAVPISRRSEEGDLGRVLRGLHA